MLSTLEVLGSSSKGNAYVLTFDNGKVIQLDAGVKNKDYKKVNQLFLSHHHIDHDKFISDYDESIIVEPITENRKQKEGRNYYSFNLYHINNDGTPIVTNCYYIREDGENILYLTDCGDLDTISFLQVPQATIVIVECNWDYVNVCNGSIKLQDYSKRSMSKGGHLNNLNTLTLLGRLRIRPDCKILFVHGSENHTNDLTYKIFDCLPNKKIVAKKGMKIYAKSWKAI